MSKEELSVLKNHKRKFLGMPAVCENYFGKKYKHNVHFPTKNVAENIGNWLETGPQGKWGWYYEAHKTDMEMMYDEPVRKEHVVLSFENGEDALICRMKK
tara:strand:- start:865 stop:1164 length:300 start_codon:yes stop_codon:yes gene_type:complete